jgi:hypothetical protein
MKDNTIKTAIASLILSALIVGLAIPKESGMLDVVLFAAMMTTFLYIVLPTQKS